MRGISKEELRRLRDHYFSLGINPVIDINNLIEQCKELNPWLPIENAPKDKPLLLFVKYPEYIIEGSYNKDYEEWHDIDFNVIKPTHYQELPEGPVMV